MALPHLVAARLPGVASSAIAPSRAILLARYDRLVVGGGGCGLGRRPTTALVHQTLMKRAASSKMGDGKKAAISRAIASNEARASTTSAAAPPVASSSSPVSAGAAAVRGGSEKLSDAERRQLFEVFGLRPIDHSVLPPIFKSPPPPPARTGPRRYLVPGTMLFTLGTVAYFYANNKNDNFEYWEAMQSGEALRMDGDEDEEYEDEEDYEEEVDGEGGEVQEEEVRAAAELRQTKQLIHSESVVAGVVDDAQSIPTKGRGWFGWLRGRRRGGEENSPTAGS